MKGMKSCSKCKGGECKGGKNCMREEDDNGKKGVTVAIMVGLPKRGMRTATSKAKKK